MHITTKLLRCSTLYRSVLAKENLYCTFCIYSVRTMEHLNSYERVSVKLVGTHATSAIGIMSMS